MLYWDPYLDDPWNTLEVQPLLPEPVAVAVGNVYYPDPYLDDPWNTLEVQPLLPEPVKVYRDPFDPTTESIYLGLPEPAPEPEPVYRSPSEGMARSIAFWTDPNPVITEEISPGITVTRPLDFYIPEPEEEKGMGLLDKIKAAVGAAVDPIVDTGGFLVDQAGAVIDVGGEIVSSVADPVVRATGLIPDVLKPIAGVLPSIGLPPPLGVLPRILPSIGPSAHHAEAGTGPKLSPMNIPWWGVGLALGTVALAVVAIRKG